MHLRRSAWRCSVPGALISAATWCTRPSWRTRPGSPAGRRPRCPARPTRRTDDLGGRPCGQPVAGAAGQPELGAAGLDAMKSPIASAGPQRLIGRRPQRHPRPELVRADADHAGRLAGHGDLRAVEADHLPARRGSRAGWPRRLLVRPLGFTISRSGRTIPLKLPGLPRPGSRPGPRRAGAAGRRTARSRSSARSRRRRCRARITAMAGHDRSARGDRRPGRVPTTAEPTRP